MYRFKITKIITNDDTEITPKRINVIVGPNGSGKSRFLKDIRNSMSSYNVNNGVNRIVIKNMEYNLPKTKEEFIEGYNLEKRIGINQNHDGFILKNYSGFNLDSHIEEVKYGIDLSSAIITLNNQWKEELDRYIQNFYMPISEEEMAKKELELQGKNPEEYDIENKQRAINRNTGEVIDLSGGSSQLIIPPGEGINDFLRNYGELFYQYIGTDEKLLSVRSQNKYGIYDQNSNLLSELSFNMSVLNECSELCKKLFGLEIYLDEKYLQGRICLRVSKDFNYIRESKRYDSDKDIRLSKESRIDDEGDGIKSFVSTYLNLKLNNKDIIIIDEPEAFLHPPVVKVLGKLIADASINKQVFISTHNADLVSSLIENCDDINIIRIERNESINNVSVANDKLIKNLIKQPMILKSNMMNGLFSKKVLIVESYSDDIFYQCLLSYSGKVDDYYIVSSQGKDKIPSISSFFEKMNIKTISVYDFDFFRYKKGEKTLKNALKNKISDEEYTKVLKMTQVLTEKIEKSVENEENKEKTVRLLFHKNGYNQNVFSTELKKEILRTIELLKKIGIIVLPFGCLESSLGDKVPFSENNKSGWLEKGLEYILNLESDEIKDLEVYKIINDNQE